MASERRKSSLGDIISRLHPSNRRERGHTLRPAISSNQFLPSRIEPIHTDPTTNDDDTQIKHGRRRLRKILGSMNSGASSTINIGHRAEHTGESVHSQASTVVQRAQSTRSKVFGSMKSRVSSTGSIDHQAEHAADSAHIQLPQSSRSRVLGLAKSKAPSTDIGHRAEYAAENAHSQASPVQRPGQEMKPTVDDKEITSEQQISNMKTAHKQHRRNLRASGDFLGVRGANPRTGRYDTSEGTTSTELSQFNDDYKRKIESEKLRHNAPKTLSTVMQESLTEVLRKAELEEAQKKQEERTERKRRIAEREARNRQRAIIWTPDKDSWNKSPLSPIPQSPTRSAASSTREARQRRREEKFSDLIPVNIDEGVSECSTRREPRIDEHAHNDEDTSNKNQNPKPSQISNPESKSPSLSNEAGPAFVFHQHIHHHHYWISGASVRRRRHRGSFH